MCSQTPDRSIFVVTLQVRIMRFNCEERKVLTEILLFLSCQFIHKTVWKPRVNVRCNGAQSISCVQLLGRHGL